MMFNRLNSLLFIGLSFVLLTIGIVSRPVQLGDGHEYSLTVKAFLNNSSPNITVNEISGRLSDISKFESTGYIPENLKKIGEGIENKENNAGGVGIYKAKNNHYYGYHFWFYPFLTALIEKILSILDINPLKSFQMTNVIMLVCALFVLFREEKKKFITQLLFLSGGVIFYLKWSHPEVMIYVFLFFAYYYLMKLRPIASALFIALASIQVVSLSLLFLVIPVYLSSVKSRNIFLIISNLLKYWQIWACGVISISSIIFYYLEFNQLSLIGSQASSISNINVGHFVSYYFDLDQGLWVGAPWLVIFILFAFYRREKIVVRDFLFSILFSVIICIPLLANNNMNSGQNVFQRYALYSISPIIAWCCVYATTVLNKSYKKIVIIFLAFLYIVFSNGYETDANYLTHKPWTSFLLEHYPQLYNPEPKIFILRTFPYTMWAGKGQDSYAYKNKDGVVTKIIFRDNSKILFNDTCKDGYKDFVTHQPIDFANSSKSNYGWRYITGNMYCDEFAPIYRGAKYTQDISDYIDFRKSGLPDFVIGASGISHEEDWGRWSDGNNIKLNLGLKVKRNVTFFAEISPFYQNAGKDIILTINNESNVMKPVDGKENTYYAKFDSVEEKENTAITIRVPSPISPSELGINNDTRKIGLGLMKFYWH